MLSGSNTDQFGQPLTESEPGDSGREEAKSLRQEGIQEDAGLLRRDRTKTEMLKTQPVQQAVLAGDHDFQVDAKRQVTPVPPLNQSLTQSKESQVVEAVFIDTPNSREASDSSAGQIQPLGPSQLQTHFMTQQVPGGSTAQPARGAFRHFSNDDKQVQESSEATAQGFKPVMAGPS